MQWSRRSFLNSRPAGLLIVIRYQISTEKREELEANHAVYITYICRGWSVSLVWLLQNGHPTPMAIWTSWRPLESPSTTWTRITSTARPAIRWAYVHVTVYPRTELLNGNWVGCARCWWRVSFSNCMNKLSRRFLIGQSAVRHGDEKCVNHTDKCRGLVHYLSLDICTYTCVVVQEFYLHFSLRIGQNSEMTFSLNFTAFFW